MTLKPTIFVLPFLLLASLTSLLFADTVAAPNADEISRLIAQLGDDDCMVRNNAQELLLSYGAAVKPELEKALTTAEDPEIYQRLQFIVKSIPLVWDEPGDEPELTEFIHQYRNANNLARMVALENLRRYPIDFQIKILDRIIRKEQNNGSVLFAAMALWYWRPESDSPQYAQLVQAVNKDWKDYKHPAVKNLYYLVNYKKIRAEATLWFDNQLRNMLELNRIPTKSIDLIPEYIGSILAEFARRQAESLMTDAELAGEKRIDFPAPRFGSSSTVIVNGVIQHQFNIRTQVLISIRNASAVPIYRDQYLAFVPFLGPVYLSHQGMKKEAESWINLELSNPASFNISECSLFAEILHEYDFNKAAADILEQNNKSNENMEQSQVLSRLYAGHAEYYRACQAKQENKPELLWNYLLKSLKANNESHDALIMQWELCQVPANENKIAAITDDVRKEIEDTIEKTLSKMDEDISNNGDGTGSFNNYAWLAVKTNRYLDKALAFAKEAVESNPSSSACMDTLAHCYAANGDVDKAIEIQQKAIQMNPLSQELYKNLVHFKELKEKEKKDSKQ